MTPLHMDDLGRGIEDGGSFDDDFLGDVEEELAQIDEEIIKLEGDKKRQSLGIDRKLRALKKQRIQVISVMESVEELDRIIERNAKVK